MRKETSVWIGLGLGTLTATSFLAGRFCEQNKMLELVTDALNSYSMHQIAQYIDPTTRDVDNDGDSDLVMTLNSGEEFVLYNDGEGNYSPRGN